ncbi:hypothetical protein V2J09_005585 [Rumex salicifolius]
MRLFSVTLLMGFLGFAVVNLLINPCKGEVYMVGDSTGWTSVAHFDYRRWASTKTFRIGDVVVFIYVQRFHNVMQVSQDAYEACNASFPISIHTSGSDSIVITGYGHHFFVCGSPGHCQLGQKVDINVIPPFSPLASSPFPSTGSTLPPPADYDKASASLNQPTLIISRLLAFSATLLLVLVG